MAGTALDGTRKGAVRGLRVPILCRGTRHEDPHAVALIAALVPALAACGSNKTTAAAVAADAETPQSFEACIAALQPNCSTAEMDTAAKMETPCASLTVVPVPLTDGGAYGPVAIPGGPYGGQMMWNQGKGTEFVNPVNTAEPICIPTGVQTFKEPASLNRARS